MHYRSPSSYPPSVSLPSSLSPTLTPPPQALLQGYAKDQRPSGGGGRGVGGGPDDEEWFSRLPEEVQAQLRDPRAWKGMVPEHAELAEAGKAAAAVGGAGGGLLFGSLPPRVQLIVRPYLDSKFTLEDVGGGGERGGSGSRGGADPSAASAAPPHAPPPAAASASVVIFGRQRHSFRRWLELWLKAMSRSVQGQHQAAFSAVTSVLKWDLPLMMFLLPQVREEGGGGR